MNRLLRRFYAKIKIKDTKSYSMLALPSLLVIISSMILFGDTTSYNLIDLKKSRATASSRLVEKGLPESFYSPEKAVDGNMKTSWCANAKGDAIVGQSLTLEFQPTAATGFRLFPGVGASGEWYWANNAITKAKITVTDTAGNNHEFNTLEYRADCYDPRGREKEEKYDKELCGFSNYGATGMGVVFNAPLCVKKVTITILKVQRGLKYDDTCISETALQMPGGAEPVPKEFTDFSATCR